MELVYLYLAHAYGEDFNIHLDFSHKLKIRFNKKTKKISIEKLTHKHSNFFGKNINNVTAIVGKNGVGKTTIVESLYGFNNSWLAVYYDGKKIYFEKNFRSKGRIVEMSHSESLKPQTTVSCYQLGLDKNYDINLNDMKDITSDYSENYDHLGIICVNKKINRTNEGRGIFVRIMDKEVYQKEIFEFLTDFNSSKIFKMKKTNGLNITLNEPPHSYFKEKLTIFEKYKEGKFLKKLSEFWQSSEIFNYEKKNGFNRKEMFIYLFHRLLFDTAFIFLLNLKKQMIDDYHNEDVKTGRFGKKYREDCAKNFNFISDQLNSIIDIFDFAKVTVDDLEQHINNFFDNFKKHNGYACNGYLKLFTHQFPDSFFDFDSVIKILNNIDENRFVGNRFLVLDKDVFFELKDSILLLLSNFDVLINKYNFLNVVKFDYGDFSSGEMQIIRIFSWLHTNVKIYSIYCSSILIIIDEYDLNMHPEWSRRFLKYLIDLLGTYKNIKFQIILTTHTPFLISDLPKFNIKMIYFNEDSQRVVTSAKNGFASNYYDILSDSFFLEDTIGEFAKQKINGWITELNELENSSAFDSDFAKLTRIDELKELINIVDDQFIRNKLLELAEDVRKTILKQADKDLQASLIDKEIEKLVEMKRKLKEENQQDD